MPQYSVLMITNYLQDCLRRFPEVTQKVYGVTSDLAAIEASVASLRTRKTLTYDDLKAFESPGWGFNSWWVFPPEQYLTPALSDREFRFLRLPRGEASLIRSLLKVFRSIELVSIILRFIRPEHYGIISPPVERMLDVRRGSDAAETYENYLKDLGKITKHYGFQRVADADMALWVLHERCFGITKDERALTNFKRDPFIRKIRAQNLMEGFLKEFNYAELANALLDTKHIIAAQFGGIAFEQMIRSLAPKGEAWDRRDLRGVIEELHNNKDIRTFTYGEWDLGRITRNRAIHLNPPPTEQQAKHLIALLGFSEPPED